MSPRPRTTTERLGRLEDQMAEHMALLHKVHVCLAGQHDDGLKVEGLLDMVKRLNAEQAAQYVKLNDEVVALKNFKTRAVYTLRGAAVVFSATTIYLWPVLSKVYATIPAIQKLYDSLPK